MYLFALDIKSELKSKLTSISFVLEIYDKPLQLDEEVILIFPVIPANTQLSDLNQKLSNFATSNVYLIEFGVNCVDETYVLFIINQYS